MEVRAARRPPGGGSISTMRVSCASPSPGTLLERGPPRQPQRLGLRLFRSSPSHGLLRSRDLGTPPRTSSSCRKISVASLAMASAISTIMRAPFRGCRPRIAVPAGWRNRANIVEDWLEAARAPQLVHLLSVAVFGGVLIRSRCTSSGRWASTAKASISPPWVSPPQAPKFPLRRSRPAQSERSCRAPGAVHRPQWRAKEYCLRASSE